MPLIRDTMAVFTLEDEEIFRQKKWSEFGHLERQEQVDDSTT